MLNEKQLQRYADVMLWGLTTARSRRFKKNDIVQVRFNLPALRLAELLHERILERGLNPVMRFSPTPTMERNFFHLAKPKQLVFQPPGAIPLYENLNGSIFLHAPESITHLSDVDPKKIARFTISRKPLRDILDKRDAAGLFGWTLCMLPTSELAQHAKMGLDAYTGQVIKACFLNRKEPVKQWEEIFKKAATLKRWLNRMRVKHYHVESPHIDLEVTPGEKRRWIGISGHNIPSFELFLSPDWRGTRGHYYANQPSYRSGNYVEGVYLEFDNGRVKRVQAETGEAFVKQQLNMDTGASQLGEFSLTDKRFSKIDRFMANTLYDENFGGRQGNCHVAVGSSYADTYSGDPAELTRDRKADLGFNDSALHWDLVNTEKKRVSAHLSNGNVVTIYENGQFTY
ncbi:MAG: aminopeptidase [Desulfosarcinaceae bacterium]|nr:aminopeptidase [Desulfosarcinaceae bacterium]